MVLINIANPWVLLTALFITLCFMYIGKEAKSAAVALLPLIAFLVLLVMHGLQYLTMSTSEIVPILSKCLFADFIMIFLTYISYLWIDDIESKAKKKKSIDNSLEWFWKNV